MDDPLTCFSKIFFEKCFLSIFPDDLKIAKVTPLFKAGDNTELSN